MKKVVLIVFSALIFLPSFSFFSYADDLPVIDTPLDEPVPVYEVVDNSIHITYAYVYLHSATQLYVLSVYDAYFPINTHFYVQKSGTGMFRFDNQPTSGIITDYFLNDGSILHIDTDVTGPRLNDTISNLNSPNYFKWVWMNDGTFYYPDNPSFPVETPLKNRICYVNWGVRPASLHVFHSSLSEPVADEYNRYIVLGSHDSQSAYLYMISFNEIEFEFTSSSTGTRNVSHNGQLWSLTCAISDDDIGIGFLFQPPSTLDQLSYMKFEMMISKYDLLTGEYLGSQLFGDVQSSSSFEIDVSSFFDSPDEYGSICVYGISCFINGPVYHRFSCIWQTDPDFVSWRQSVEDYLDKIYVILNQDGEDVTISQDMSAIDEGQSAMNDLKVTDSQGNEIDAAQQVEAAFSEAASGMDNMSSGISSVNNIISDLFFQEPMILIVLIVFLALGLIVTILGKNVTN